VERLDNDSKLTLVVNKSGALNNLGRYSEAIKLLEEYLKVGENDKIHKNIADAYYNINVLDKAIYHYERAIKYNSQFDEAYFNVAVILYRQDSFFNAKMNIEKALRINNTQEHYLELHSHIQERISMNHTKV
jgi:rhomboid protease GluP